MTPSVRRRTKNITTIILILSDFFPFVYPVTTSPQQNDYLRRFRVLWIAKSDSSQRTPPTQFLFLSIAICRCFVQQSCNKSRPLVSKDRPPKQSVKNNVFP